MRPAGRKNGEATCSIQPKKERERKGVRGVFNPNNPHPKRLHYP